MSFLEVVSGIIEACFGCQEERRGGSLPRSDLYVLSHENKL